jgi:hypothetical protein
MLKVANTLRNNNKGLLFPKIGIPFFININGIINMVGTFRKRIISIKGISGTNFIKMPMAAKQVAAISIIKIPCVFILVSVIFIDDD